MDTDTLHHDNDNDIHSEQPVQQLSLLPTPEVPLQFRLDAETRRRGLRHVAEIRRMLDERQAAKSAEQQRPFTPRRAA
jgi:hypothetical protein